jgi:histidyl-tRNA synthetase
MTDEEKNELAARLPRGFRDVTAEEVLQREEMMEKIKRVYRRYGFEPLETPHVEYLDALGKHLPESDTPEGGVFAFKDDSKNWVALRYDLTAPLARYFSEHEKELPLPFRRYQAGPVFRLEKPGPGRFREFYQCDFDTVGAGSVAADAEACMILVDALDELGIKPGNFEIRVNNRKVLNGLMESAGISGADTTLDERGLVVMRAIDKLDRIGIEGVEQLLGPGRKDESGDFTKGAGLSKEQIFKLITYLRIKAGSRESIIGELSNLVQGSQIGEEGVEELRLIDELLTAAGYGSEILYDPMVVRGLAYYTGPVYEAALTFMVEGEEGGARQFGSVAGGGRYDNLVERFLHRKVPATGASIGVDRLLAALRHLGVARSTTSLAPVLVTAMDQRYLNEYQKMTAELRRAGIPAEMYLDTGGFRKQMKYADRKNMPLAVICGEDEFAAGNVSIKDLLLGKELSKNIEERADWTKDRPAQATVPRGDLVETVRRMLKQQKA